MTPEDIRPDARAASWRRRSWNWASDKVAAFIGEPMQGAGGVIIPPTTYWPEIQRIVRQVRHPADRGRGHHRLRAHRQLVRQPDLRHHAAHHDHRQGPVVGLSADRRVDRLRRGGRGHRRGRRFQPRLHLFRPSGRGRGGAGEPADHAGREDRRACPRRGAPLSDGTLGRADRSSAGRRGQAGGPDGVHRADARTRRRGRSSRPKPARSATAAASAALPTT